MPVQSRYPHPLKDQRQFFDELITEDWESYKSDAWDVSRRSEIARLFRRMRPERILDIGCGCGFHDEEMAGYDFVRQVDAIDYSIQSIKKADEAYPHPRVRRRVADLETDDPGPIYDLVVSFQVLEHLADPARYFEYCLRACRPGGLIAIATPNVDRLDNRIRRWRGAAPTLVDPQHFREYSRAELLALGRRFGLVKYETFGVGLHSLIYPRLMGGSQTRAARWGRLLPGIANVIVVVFRRPAGS
jgi:2-polyprenyl-3-methyl-5-hydroxy-6-metoxy-1,4-benzoquinol methylase